MTGITIKDIDSTLIIVLIGESDLQYVLTTAWNIEKELVFINRFLLFSYFSFSLLLAFIPLKYEQKATSSTEIQKLLSSLNYPKCTSTYSVQKSFRFPNEVKSGLIQVISPSEYYYPNLDSLPSTLGDSPKRVKWRSKEVLDVLYLMAYGHTKGGYYLMMEDDVSCSKYYMKVWIFICDLPEYKTHHHQPSVIPVATFRNPGSAFGHFAQSSASLIQIFVLYIICRYRFIAT